MNNVTVVILIVVVSIRCGNVNVMFVVMFVFGLVIGIVVIIGCIVIVIIICINIIINLITTTNVMLFALIALLLL